MKKKNNIGLLVVCIIFTYTLSAQETLTLAVLKGSALVEKSKTDITNVRRSEKIILPTNANVKFSANSSILIYNKKSKLELVNATEKNYTHAQILAAFKKVKPVSLTVSFLNYLDKMYVNAENSENSFGASSAAASRGFKEDEPFYFPEDETIILEDSFELITGNNDVEIVSNILVVNDTTKEVVYNDTINKNKLVLNNLKSGHYTWTYKIKFKGSIVTLGNTFIIPTAELKAIKIKEIFEFKNSLNNCKNCLSDEAKRVLLDDFLSVNKLYYK